MNELQCLDNAIGLSRNECNCYVNDRPTDFNISKSGLYLDELEGINLRTIAGDVECGENSIWDIMERAVSNAKINLRADLLGAIMDVHKNTRKPFNGLIGQIKYKNPLVISNTWAGLRIKTYDLKGGLIQLKGITTLMDSNVSFDVYIYNNYQSTPLYQLTGINAQAGTATANTINGVDLPTFIEGVDDLEYYIIYQPSGFSPLDNKIDCGCSGRREWQNWINIYGISGDNINEREEWLNDGYANGLAINVSIVCNTVDLICGGDGTDELDFNNDGIAMALAYALRFKAGEILIEEILASGNINRYTLLDKERLWGKRNHYRTEYRTRIIYIADNIDISTNDCIVCGNKNISKTSILV